MDEIYSTIQALEEGNTRRIDGLIVDPFTKRKYNYKAYTISNPQNLIRIDIRRIK